jgi:hypothetical protein
VLGFVMLSIAVTAGAQTQPAGAAAKPSGAAPPAPATATAPAGSPSTAASSPVDASDPVSLIRQSRDPSSAIEAYARALGAHADVDSARKAFTRRMIDLGTPELADAQAAETLRSNPNDALALTVSAYVSAARGQGQAAAVQVAAALQQNAAEPFVQRTAGQIVAWFDTNPTQLTEDVKPTIEWIKQHFAGLAEYADAYAAAVAAANPSGSTQPAAERSGPKVLEYRNGEVVEPQSYNDVPMVGPTYSGYYGSPYYGGAYATYYYPPVYYTNPFDCEYVGPFSSGLIIRSRFRSPFFLSFHSGFFHGERFHGERFRGRDFHDRDRFRGADIIANRDRFRGDRFRGESGFRGDDRFHGENGVRGDDRFRGGESIRGDNFRAERFRGSGFRGGETVRDGDSFRGGQVIRGRDNVRGSDNVRGGDRFRAESAAPNRQPDAPRSAPAPDRSQQFRQFHGESMGPVPPSRSSPAPARSSPAPRSQSGPRGSSSDTRSGSSHR